MPIFGSAQFITEHLLDDTKTYSPLFGKDKGTLRVRLDMAYTHPNKDTIFACVIDVSERKSKLEGIVNSSNISGAITGLNNYGLLGGIAALGFGKNKSYSITNTQGIAILDHLSLDSLVSNINTLKSYSKLEKGIPRIILIKVGKVFIGLELKSVFIDTDIGTILEKSYYLQIDDSTFKLTVAEFNDLSDILINSIKYTWDTYLDSGTLSFQKKRLNQ